MKKILLGGSPCTFWSVVQRSKTSRKVGSSLKILSRLLCSLDLPCISTVMHKICDECLLRGIKADDDHLPLICKEVNAVSRKLEKIK